MAFFYFLGREHRGLGSFGCGFGESIPHVGLQYEIVNDKVCLHVFIED